MKTLIAGFGFVGKEVGKLFPESDVYDPSYDGTISIDLNNLYTNKYDVCFVCVPTPMKEDGSCDTLFVEDVITKTNADLFIIRSTIPPGTIDELEAKHKKNLVMQPEYVASSSPYPAPLADISKRDFIIIGGRPESTKKARRVYETVYPPTCKIMECSAVEAELIKYGENCFIATKVTFCNEFYDMCKKFDVDYDVWREGVFRLDPRMTSWWSYVYEDKRGWGGHCLGKDVNAIINKTDSKFMRDVVECNNNHRSK